MMASMKSTAPVGAEIVMEASGAVDVAAITGAAVASEAMTVDIAAVVVAVLEEVEPFGVADSKNHRTSCWC